MLHGGAEQNGVPAASPGLRRTVQEPIRYSPELCIVPQCVQAGVGVLRDFFQTFGIYVWSSLRSERPRPDRAGSWTHSGN